MPSNPQSKTRNPQRPFLGIIFKCCSVYGRLYRNDEGSAYEGACPRCMRPVSILAALGAAWHSPTVRRTANKVAARKSGLGAVYRTYN